MNIQPGPEDCWAKCVLRLGINAVTGIHLLWNLDIININIVINISYYQHVSILPNTTMSWVWHKPSTNTFHITAKIIFPKKIIWTLIVCFLCSWRFVFYLVAFTAGLASLIDVSPIITFIPSVFWMGYDITDLQHCALWIYVHECF